ncbi:MAG: hypothetical protein ABI398_00860 [Devosia sp.]
MKASLIALGFVAVLVLPAAAADYVLITPADPVIGSPTVIYLDLLRQVIPDLAQNGPAWTGHLPPGIGHIDGPDAEGAIPDSVTIRSVDVRTVAADGKATIWVIADLGDGGNLGTYTLLAAFSDGPAPKLLDATEVDSDRLTGFSGTPLRISSRDEAVLIDSEYSNSSQTYQSQDLVFLRGGKFMLIDHFFAFGTRSCDFQQLEILSVTAAPGGPGFWPITAVLTRSQAETPKVESSQEDENGDTCLEEETAHFADKDFTAVYAWDEKAGRYFTKSTELDDLATADSDLF